jgi:hypothetical protein
VATSLIRALSSSTDVTVVLLLWAMAWQLAHRDTKPLATSTSPSYSESGIYSFALVRNHTFGRCAHVPPALILKLLEQEALEFYTLSSASRTLEEDEEMRIRGKRGLDNLASGYPMSEAILCDVLSLELRAKGAHPSKFIGYSSVRAFMSWKLAKP